MASPPVPQDPTLPIGYSLTFRNRFWSKVKKTSRCWIWTAGVTHGNGSINKGMPGAGAESSNRASWIIHFGKLPERRRITSKCRNPLCVRPSHLIPATRPEELLRIGKDRKRCSRCKRMRPLVSFLFKRRGRFLNLSKCKKCRIEITHNYYLANKTHKANYQRKYASLNRDEINHYSNNNYWKYRDLSRLQSKRWHSRNRVRISRYRIERYRTNTQYALRCRLSQRMRCALRRVGVKKKNKTIDLIGCDWSTAIDHLQSLFVTGMSWKNRDRWHIDHKTPLATFDLTKDSEMRAAFHYTNLQPLWSEDNQSKGCKTNWINESTRSSNLSQG